MINRVEMHAFRLNSKSTSLLLTTNTREMLYAVVSNGGAGIRSVTTDSRLERCNEADSNRKAIHYDIIRIILLPAYFYNCQLLALGLGGSGLPWLEHLDEGQPQTCGIQAHTRDQC
jgi:hypothetical protein